MVILDDNNFRDELGLPIQSLCLHHERTLKANVSRVQMIHLCYFSLMQGEFFQLLSMGSEVKGVDLLLHVPLLVLPFSKRHFATRRYGVIKAGHARSVILAGDGSCHRPSVDRRMAAVLTSHDFHDSTSREPLPGLPSATGYFIFRQSTCVKLQKPRSSRSVRLEKSISSL